MHTLIVHAFDACHMSVYDSATYRIGRISDSNITISVFISHTVNSQ